MPPACIRQDSRAIAALDWAKKPLAARHNMTCTTQLAARHAEGRQVNSQILTNMLDKSHNSLINQPPASVHSKHPSLPVKIILKSLFIDLGCSSQVPCSCLAGFASNRLKHEACLQSSTELFNKNSGAKCYLQALARMHLAMQLDWRALNLSHEAEHSG